MTDILTGTADASSIDHDPGPVALGLEDDATGALFATVSCPAGERIVRALQAEPLPPARLAERAETSVQNVTYHLDRLEEAGLVEVVATTRSPKGAEMDVYAAVGDPFLVTVGDTGLDPGAVTDEAAATLAGPTDDRDDPSTPSDA